MWLAWLLVALEFLLVVGALHRQFAGLWEIQWGAIWLFPAAFLASALIALGAGGLYRLLRSRTPLWRGLGAVLVGGLSVWFGFSITHGRHFEVWWRRAGFISLLALAAGVGALWLVPRVATGLRVSPKRWGAGLIVGMLGLEALNRWLLVRLYPSFHLALALLTIAAVAPFADAWFARRSPSRKGRRLAGATTLALVALSAVLPTTAQGLSRFDNFRWVLSTHAPVLGHVVQQAARLAPEPTQSEVEPIDIASAQGPGISFTERDLLLITVDALRADHLGSYGYQRATTPHLDRLARTGVRFERAYCATPHTSYSVASLMTGKYMRPLLIQGLAEDSETFAVHLQRYGYRTAAFFPPAIFFIDQQRFRTLDETGFGFEYQKREFLEGPPRVQQVVDYLEQQPIDQRVFVWVHLFAPHEPYEHHEEYDFGRRDIDRYDSEIAASDRTVGSLVEEFRQRRPEAVVIVTADHGEEFGDHGGRYHGTTVYEEQVRVPLLIDAPGQLEPAVITEPVQTIDLLPTVLRALAIPVRPRIRGRDLGSLLRNPETQSPGDPAGFAYSETDRQAMLARGPWRLVCERQLGACRLFDIAKDPGQTRDVSRFHTERFDELRREMQTLNASHGHYERDGLRAEGAGWPAPILRALSGDGDAAPEVAELLDDADVAIRRKAAEVLFRLHHHDTIAQVQLALQRDEDETVRRFCALALTRMGLGAALTGELLQSDELMWRRRAALALAEQGDTRGKHDLVEWWKDEAHRDYETSLELLDAFATIRVEEAVWPLMRSLDDVRLRPAIAEALAAIGDGTARGPLARALRDEPYHGTREKLAQALVKLGAEAELVMPLRRWLGVPDPLVSGLDAALGAGVLEYVGGPTGTQLRRLRDNASLGELATLVVPPGGNGRGVRLLVQASNPGKNAARVFVGKPKGVFRYDVKGKLLKSRKVPEIHPEHRVELWFPEGAESVLRWETAPPALDLQAGRSTHLVVYAEAGVRLEALAAVPLQDELESKALAVDKRP